MSRKDYELIAGVLREKRGDMERALRVPYENDEYYTRYETKLDALDDVARGLAYKLAEDNPRFRVDTFIKASLGDAR